MPITHEKVIMANVSAKSFRTAASFRMADAWRNNRVPIRARQRLPDTKEKRVVTEQKTIINQVNLLNAKLMFAQKATRYGKLSESQKVKVINAIDRASSVREVKLVYTSILEALKRNETSTKRPVTEGLASKSTKSVGRSTTGGDNIIKENWQRLAGILPPKDY
jgi:hypothetical protein